ncbi:MAG: dodecin domain-containing protein [Bacteroidetes bacterium]|nr:dodecin domain-containing protein [Bacteroidota bacterium]
MSIAKTIEVSSQSTAGFSEAAQAAVTEVSRTINNVKHVWVESFEMIVQDDGRGFDPDVPRQPNASGGGFGLISMRERARLLGGELRVESSPGKGTLVETTLPVG